MDDEWKDEWKDGWWMGDEWEMVDEFIRIIVWCCKMKMMDECKMDEGKMDEWVIFHIIIIWSWLCSFFDCLA